MGVKEIRKISTIVFCLEGRTVLLGDAVVCLQVTISRSGRDCSIHRLTFTGLTCSFIGHMMSYSECIFAEMM